MNRDMLKTMIMQEMKFRIVKDAIEKKKNNNDAVAEIPPDAYAEDPERDWSTDRSIEIKGMVPDGEEEQIEELELELEE